MPAGANPSSLRSVQFPPDVIRYAVISASRDVEELLAQRGI